MGQDDEDDAQMLQAKQQITFNVINKRKVITLFLGLLFCHKQPLSWVPTEHGTERNRSTNTNFSCGSQLVRNISKSNHRLFLLQTDESDMIRELSAATSVPFPYKHIYNKSESDGQTNGQLSPSPETDALLCRPEEKTDQFSHSFRMARNVYGPLVFSKRCPSLWIESPTIDCIVEWTRGKKYIGDPKV